MKLFELDSKGIPIIIPEVLLIKEFKDLLDRDISRDKSNSLQEFTYIYYYCDYNSNYAGLPDDERTIEARKDAGFPNGWTPDELIIKAIIKYRERIDSDIILLLRSAKIALHKLRIFFETVDFTLLNDKGIPIYNPKDIMSSLSNLGKVSESLDSLLQQAIRGKNLETKQRGGGKTSLFENPDDESYLTSKFEEKKSKKETRGRKKKDTGIKLLP